MATMREANKAPNQIENRNLSNANMVIIIFHFTFRCNWYNYCQRTPSGSMGLEKFERVRACVCGGDSRSIACNILTRSNYFNYAIGCVCVWVFCLCIEVDDKYIRYISTVRRLPCAQARSLARKLFRNSNFAIRRLIVWARCMCLYIRVSGLILWHIFGFPVKNSRWHTLWRLTLFTWFGILFNSNSEVFIIYMLIACVGDARA